MKKDCVHISEPLADQLNQLTRAYINSQGQEVNNPQPTAIPSGLGRPLNLKQQIQRLMRVELSNQADAQGYETFEEANDFEMPDDSLSDTSRYTVMDEEYLSPEQIDRRIAKLQDRKRSLKAKPSLPDRAVVEPQGDQPADVDQDHG